MRDSYFHISTITLAELGEQISKRRTEARRGRYADGEASIISEMANDRLFGFVFTTVFASVLIMNALAY